MKVFGLTGGIGMGKSTAARLLRERSVPVIDTDVLARQIVEPGACAAASHRHEQPWDDLPGAAKPVFRQFHHAQDGIHDQSCVAKARAQLLARGFPEEPPFMLDGGARSAAAHAWLDAYNLPMLAFFAAQLR